MARQPDYVSFEPKAREELLSQIGTFTPLERTLFQRLCEAWAPKIDRNRFLARVGGSEQEVATIDKLLAKLRGAQLAVVTTTVIDGKRVPESIVLTNKGDLTFFMTLLEEETAKLSESGYRVLPSLERMEERKALPHDYHVTDGDSADLAKAWLGEAPEDAILRIRLLGEYRILTTTRTVRRLMENAVQWLRTTLDERSFLEEVARVKNTGIMELKQRLSEKTPDFWLEITRSILQERQTIAFRKNITESDEFFQTAFLIMNFTEAQITAAKARKEGNAQVDEELSGLASAVENVPGGRMPEATFTGLVEQADAQLGPSAAVLGARMTTDLLTPRPRRKLPVIVFLAGVYIHRNRVRSIFSNARIQVAERLREEYTDILESFLRGRSPDAGEIFSSKADLDHDIVNRAERQDPLLGELLARPQLLAEAVIRDEKLRRDAITTDELKETLKAYFNVSTSELLPPNELFDIDVVAIYDAAFGRLNVFRQLILRISGRYDSLKRHYARRFGEKRRLSYADDGDAGTPGGGRTRTERQDVPGVRTQGTGPRDHRPDTARQQRSRPAPRPARPKVKSPREVDKAWQEFNQALHTKPPRDDEFD